MELGGGKAAGRGGGARVDDATSLAVAVSAGHDIDLIPGFLSLCLSLSLSLSPVSLSLVSLSRLSLYDKPSASLSFFRRSARASRNY